MELRNKIVAAALMIGLLPLSYIAYSIRPWETGSFVGWTQAALAAGLLVATVAYTWYTKQQTASMAKPFVKCSIDNFGPVNYRMVIRNTGTGAAHNVRVKWNYGDYEQEWQTPLIPEGKQHEFPIAVEEREDSRDKLLTGEGDLVNFVNDGDTTLRFEATCGDIRGNIHEFDDEIDVERTISCRADAFELQRSDPLEDIEDSIGSVADAIDDITGEMDMEGLSGVMKARQLDRVLQILDVHGSMSVTELWRISGISPRDLSRMIRKLERGGYVECDDFFNAADAEDAQIELLESELVDSLLSNESMASEEEISGD